jgi:hypothetical protein
MVSSLGAAQCADYFKQSGCARTQAEYIWYTAPWNRRLDKASQGGNLKLSGMELTQGYGVYAHVVNPYNGATTDGTPARQAASANSWPYSDTTETPFSVSFPRRNLHYCGRI